MSVIEKKAELEAYFHDSGKPAGADHAPPGVRNVADVGDSVKRQQVMLAHRIEGDVPQDYHFGVAFLKIRG